MIIIFLVVSLLFSATITLDDIASAREITNTTILGSTMAPNVDSIRYRSLLSSDTLISGNKTLAISDKQVAWPVIAPISERKFKFSYTWFNDPGNHLYEKNIELLSDINSLSVTVPLSPEQAHRDSMGLLLTNKIIPSSMNSKAFVTPSGKHIRVLQGNGGKDSIIVVDTTLGVNAPVSLSLMDSLISEQTYPDYCINSGGDTLFAVFSPSLTNSKIIVTPIRITQQYSYIKLPHITIVNDGAIRRDYGIARDPNSGLFMVTAFRRQGADNIIETFRCSANLSMTHTSQIQNNLPAHTTNARIVSVCAIGNNHFAVVYFLGSNNGTYMKIVDITNNINVLSTVRLDSSVSFIPNINFSSGRLAVVWLRDQSISFLNNCRVYGKIYSIENGLIADTLYSGPLSSKSTISENYTTAKITTNSSGSNYRLGISLDSYGNLASSYLNQVDNRLYFSALVPTFFFGDTGLFTLRDSIFSATYGSFIADSIKYTGFSASNIGHGNVELFFRSSSDGNFSAAYSPVTSGSVLTTQGGSRFDLRFRLLTEVIASNAPRISSGVIQANVKPKNAKIDSIKIGSRGIVSIVSNDTIKVHRGTDSLRLYFSAMDYDNASYVQYHLSGYNTSSSTVQRISDYTYMGTAPIPPSNHSDTVYRLSFSVVDTNGWGSDSFHMYVSVRNPSPVDSVRSLVYTKQNVLSLDSLIRRNDTIFIIDSGYNVIRVFGSDSNNASLSCYYYVNGVLSSSVSGALMFNDTIYADSVHGMDTITTILADSYGKRDTTRFFVRVSHLPSLDSIYYKSLSNRLSLPLDSISLKIKTIEADTFIIKARDPDVILDDRLVFRLFVDGNLDTSCTVRDSIVTFYRQAVRTASRIVISVSDQSGVTDSAVIHLLYPLTAISSYHQDSLYLSDSLVAFTERMNATRIGVNVSNYVIAISSDGTDSLYVNSLRLKRRGGSGAFRIGTSFSRTGAVVFDTSLTIKKVPSGDTLFLIIRDSAAIPYGDSAGVRLSLTNGDTLFRDSVIITTNDPDYDTIIYPLRLTIKEPPFIVTDSLRRLGINRPLAIVYSEPMQRADTMTAPFIMYSYFDSLNVANSAGRDTTPIIPMRISFSKRDSSRFDTLFLTPICSTGLYRSSFFNLSPKDGLFISTDRIRVSVSANLRDFSGNRTDLDVDRMPDSPNARRVLSKNMDSSGLMIISVTPDSGSIVNASIPLISVTFTSPIDPGSIDSLLVGNRSVRISSAAFPDTTLSLFAPPQVSGNRLSFRTAGSMIGNDTITVTISASIRDSNGNTLDADRNGIGSFYYNYGASRYSIADTFMTSLSQTGGDNYTWLFYTGSQDFYIFPVPFEPSKNSRHAEQGGIIFKNVDALVKGKQDVSTVDLLIFTPDGVPVYSSAKHGETKSVGPGLKPLWKWKAVNDAGNSVASGLYMYCIVSGSGNNVLKRGKLVVIR